MSGPSATAEDVVTLLKSRATVEDRRSTSRRISAEQVIGVRMKAVFDLAKDVIDLPDDEVTELLQCHWYEARLTAVCILDFRARRPCLTREERETLYRTYVDHHDQIDSWDLVDRAAPRVVGGHFLDQSDRSPLRELATHADPMRRRTAITAAFWLIRAGELDEPLALVELLLDDPEPVVQTSVGIALRELAKTHPKATADYVAANRSRISGNTRRLARLPVSPRSPKRRLG